MTDQTYHLPPICPKCHALHRGECPTKAGQSLLDPPGSLEALRQKAICESERSGNLLSENRKLRQALNRLHATAGKRMMADDPTVDERIEFMEAWKAAGEILSANQ